MISLINIFVIVGSSIPSEISYNSWSYFLATCNSRTISSYNTRSLSCEHFDLVCCWILLCPGLCKQLLLLGLVRVEKIKIVTITYICMLRSIVRVKCSWDQLGQPITGSTNCELASPKGVAKFARPVRSCFCLYLCRCVCVLAWFLCARVSMSGALRIGWCSDRNTTVRLSCWRVQPLGTWKSGGCLSRFPKAWTDEDRTPFYAR